MSTAAAARNRVAGYRGASATRHPARRWCGNRRSAARPCCGPASPTRGPVPLASEPIAPELTSHQVVTAEVPSAERTLTLRHNDCFGLFNEIGDIDAEARGEAGLYRAGVRYL